MSLLKRRKPFITAKQVADRIGGYSPKSVTNGVGVFKRLTVYRLEDGGRLLYDPDEVEQLIQAARRNAEQRHADAGQ